jgi:hypothetical protein
MNRRTTQARRSLRRGLVITATLATAGLVLAGSAGGIGTYADRTGDAGSAPDITGVTVTSDETSGLIVFRINVTSLPTPGDVRTALLIDSDANPVTGDLSVNGSDYLFVVDESDHTFIFGHWYGSDWDNAPSSLSVRVRSDARGVTIWINRTELGNTSEFNFWAETHTGDASSGKRDSAPDQGQWNYALDANGPHITGAKVTTAPVSGPRAGKRFAITNVALQLPPTMGVQITPRPDSYSCTATLGGKRLAGAGCSWAVPKKKSRGKRLIVQLTVQYQGAKKTLRLPFIVV